VLIEDAAHALPAHYRGRPIGSGTNPTAFSFYATKNMTTAEGGMLTGTADFVAEARMISLHGMSHDAWKRYDKKGTWKYDVLMPGFKYNMTDVQASLGLWQLRKLRGFHRRREEIAAQYSAAFADEEGIEVPVALPHVGHAWHLYVALLRPGYLTIGRDEFIELLRERNVGASVHFIPVHEHRFYRQKYDHEEEDFPVAHDRFTRMLSLPLHPRLSDDNVADVCGVVRDLLHSHRR
jgi:dTDP-4-amino-4,6-dideoxygalactose transaminase